MPTRPSPRSERLGTPNTPAIRFTRGPFFEASLVRHCYGLPGCSPPWTDLTGSPQPPGAFTSRLPTGRSPFPSLDMTTTATGLLCWRDFHPQEWQLASLHQTLWRDGATRGSLLLLAGSPGRARASLSDGLRWGPASRCLLGLWAALCARSSGRRDHRGSVLGARASQVL